MHNTVMKVFFVCSQFPFLLLLKFYVMGRVVRPLISSFASVDDHGAICNVLFP